MTLSLAPLDDADTARLIGTLMGRSGLPTDSQAALLERAAGNPLYAEQYVRMLDERTDSLALPETVHGIIAARLDALSTEEKAILQDAAVLGKVFWTGGLHAIGGVESWRAEELLHGLDRKEFVRRARRASLADEREYAFRHVLVRDAYSQIPRAARAEKHKQAALWIESLGRIGDHAEMLARHYVSALELSPAGSTVELEDHARRALRAAGDRAFALNAFDAAARYYEQPAP